MFESIFIVGTGRSGTHFLNESLLQFRNIYNPFLEKENSRIQSLITKNIIHSEKLDSQIKFFYKQQINKLKKKLIFLDKCHPNLFYLNYINKISKKSIYFYLYRPMSQIVSSMYDHEGVNKWYEYILQYKVRYPNIFLGLNSETDLKLKKYILFTKRIISHHKYALKMKKKYKERFRIVLYDDLVRENKKTLFKLFYPNEKKMIGKFTREIKCNITSLKKFKKKLNNNQINEIDFLDKEFKKYFENNAYI